MNLQISDEELCVLEQVRDQLGLISGLLCLKDAELGCIDTAGLYAFIDAREREIDRIVDAVNGRRDALRAARPMAAIDWALALRIARGDALYSPQGAEASIAARLACAAEVDAGFELVREEWSRTLQQARRGQSGAAKATRTTRAAAPGTPTRQRKAA